MNAQKFLDAMNEIDDRYIAEALFYQKKTAGSPRSRRLSVVLAAAALALFLMGAGVAAAVYGDSIQNWFYHHWERITGQQMSDGQAAVIDHLSQELGLDQTVGDVTVTVDSATVGQHDFYLLLRIAGLRFSDESEYDFFHISMKTRPDAVDGSGGMGGYRIRCLGVDGDGAALVLLYGRYLDGSGGAGDTGPDTCPLEISLTLKDLRQDANTDKEKILAAGEWSYAFSLDRSMAMQSVALSDIAVTVMDAEKAEPAEVLLCDIELTSTGLTLWYDDSGRRLSIVNHIYIILENGERIGVEGGMGREGFADGETIWEVFYDWQVPVNLEEAVRLQIGETEILIPDPYSGRS